MRFGAHQTFHLRDSWLYKGLQAVSQNGKLLNEAEAAEELGVGKNMVEAIKFWLTALQLVEVDSKSREYKLTKIAKTILEYDPYFELDGTLILIHYLLATNFDGATSWYWFFNKLGATEFDIESLNVLLSSYVENQQGKKINEKTLAKDITCLVRMYKEPEYKERVTPETENPSPFVKFNVITMEDKKIYKKKFKTQDIDSRVFAYLMYLFWKDQLQEATSVNLDEFVTKEKSPGLVLGLNIEDTIFLVEQVLKEFSGKYIEFNRTGGYSIINIDKATASKALHDYYKAARLMVN